jgi:small subunit ribosomal protein S3Ae
MAKSSQKAAVKLRKKRWFPIVAPKAFNEILIGEIPAYEIQELEGRTLTINLMFLTNDPKKQQINLAFKVIGIEDSKTVTTVVEYSVSPSFVRRLVRRGKGRIDASVILKTKDDKFIRIKPMVLTKGLATSSVRRQLTKKMRELVQKRVQLSQYDQLIKDIIAGKFQVGLKEELKKIYPVSVAEVRVLKMVNDPGNYTPVPIVEEEAPKIDTEPDKPAVEEAEPVVENQSA